MTKRVQLGMSMFLIAETVFFFLLIIAFAYFRAMPHRFAHIGLFFTALLAASTFTMWLASVGPPLWRCVTIALGIAFLVNQAFFYGSAFFPLVGVHALHVLAGLLALAIVPSAALRGLALYWYFFAATWLVIVLVASQT